MYEVPQQPSFWESNRIFVKALLTGFLILIMFLPAQLVNSLINEREQRQKDVVSEVSSKWAGKQTITGPVLMVPYKEYASKDGKTTVTTKIAYILPDELHITGEMQPHEKKRSLYSVMLYHSDIKLAGKFGSLPLTQLGIAPESVDWQNVKLVLSVGDLKGINEQVQLSWNGSKQQLDAGVPDNQLMSQGVSAPVPVTLDGTSSFEIDMSLLGSDYLYFTSTGKTTDVSMKGDWKDPAFDGQYLPISSDITNKGFTAQWKVLPLSHTYPQYWKNSTQDLNSAAFGVRLIQPVDGYSKTNRSIKYAILFIALTFAFIFFTEILQKVNVHALQYILVGLALTIFYTLLLSVSEYTGFNIAYLLASVATVSLIGLYASSVFKNNKNALGLVALLCALYGYIFILIQLEDYALLFGSIGLFVILAIIMYYSRKIEWKTTTDAPAPAMAHAAPPVKNDLENDVNEQVINES